jgi:hypothetical protein
VKYLGKKFSSPPNSKEFVDNWDAIFGTDKPAKTDDASKGTTDEKQER